MYKSFKFLLEGRDLPLLLQQATGLDLDHESTHRPRRNFFQDVYFALKSFSSTNLLSIFVSRLPFSLQLRGVAFGRHKSDLFGGLTFLCRKNFNTIIRRVQLDLDITGKFILHRNRYFTPPQRIRQTVRSSVWIGSRRWRGVQFKGKFLACRRMRAQMNRVIFMVMNCGTNHWSCLRCRLDQDILLSVKTMITRSHYRTSSFHWMIHVPSSLCIQTVVAAAGTAWAPWSLGHFWVRSFHTSVFTKGEQCGWRLFSFPFSSLQDYPLSNGNDIVAWPLLTMVKNFTWDLSCVFSFSWADVIWHSFVLFQNKLNYHGP